MGEGTTYVWKDTARLTRLVSVLTLLCMVVLLAKAAVVIFLGPAGVYSPEDTQWTGPQAVAVLVDACLILTLPAGAAGLAWIWRVNANAHLIEPAMRFSPLGAAGFYFVPVVSYFLPLQAMAEIWRVSAGRREEPDAPRLLALWWGGFVLFSLANAATQIASVRSGAQIAMAAGGIVGGAAFITIVRRIDALQRERRAPSALGRSTGAG